MFPGKLVVFSEGYFFSPDNANQNIFVFTLMSSIGGVTVVQGCY